MSNFKTIYDKNYITLQMHGSVLPSKSYGDELVAELFEQNLKKHKEIAPALADTAEELFQLPGAWTLVATDRDTGGRAIVTDLLGRDQAYYRYFPDDMLWEIGPTVRWLRPSHADELYFASVAKFGYHIGHRTYAKGVYRVLPGQMTLLSRSGQVCFMPFSTDTSFKKHPPFSDLVITAFYDSLPRDLDGLTVLVSGGLDSSIIAHLVMQNIKEGGRLADIPVQFLTTTNGEDVDYAKLLSEAEGFKLDFIDSEDWLESDTLLDALLAADSPIDLGSLVPNYRLIKEAKYNNIITGDGPDELFGGYARIHEYDSQKSDIFQELSYYHLPKLNQTAMALGKRLICPYLDPNILSYALSLDLPERTDKKVLKEAFRGVIPCAIIDRQKFALKSNLVRQDKIAHRMKCISLFQDYLKPTTI